jgi:hypothetical protein
MTRKTEIERNREEVRRIRSKLAPRKSFHKYFWPSAKAVDDILKETGSNFIPADLDVEQLRRDLNEFGGKYLEFAAQTKTQQRVRLQVSKKMRRHAQGLYKCLAKPQDYTLDLDLWPLVGVDRDQLLSALQQIEHAAKFKPAPNARARKSWIVYKLDPIYSKHMHRKPGHMEGADGPFPRFVVKVASGLGVVMTKHIVEMALRPKKLRP